MVEKEKVEGMLGAYRVLDLADEKGLLCGKLLGDIGADVIKVEKSFTGLHSAPTLGEHNEYIMKGVLGMSDEDVSQLVIEGVVE